MIDKNVIRERIDAGNPEIRLYIGSAYTVASDDARERLIDSMTDAAIETGYRVLREERNNKLAASDWTQISDAPVDASAWAEYRQALRDLPATVSDFNNIVWPTPPA